MGLNMRLNTRQELPTDAEATGCPLGDQLLNLGQSVAAALIGKPLVFGTQSPQTGLESLEDGVVLVHAMDALNPNLKRIQRDPP
jgi:hypothetical protein